MPVYNAEAYVEASIRSALASDLQELEVIVVDDGSTDQSMAIVAAIGDPRVVSVRLRASGGPSRPRNVGIARARAPYVAFLDADDLVKQDKLSAAVSQLDRHPEVGFAFGNFEDIDQDGRLLRPSAIPVFPRFRALKSVPLGDDWFLIPQELLARALLFENFIGTSGVVLRRHLLTEIGPFNETTIYSEDLDLWLRLAHCSGALYCTRVGHSYRNRPGSLTHALPARSAQDHIIVLEQEKARWLNDRAARRQLDRRVAENLSGIGYEERRRQNRLRSAAMFAYAFAKSPDLRWLRGMFGSFLS
jgi:glycosyltransferase involved in cell wall biosynthesis